ncbi:MAG TPA: hypothetical protein VHQ92_11055 [Pseudolabrys sp.]|nr:hypothetical protein [Pseudolabrys sp.]
MNALAEAPSDLFAGSVFVLMVFDPDNPRANYISNGTREQMLAAMAEFIERNKAKAN